jgi:hypothetical protein
MNWRLDLGGENNADGLKIFLSNTSRRGKIASKMKGSDSGWELENGFLSNQFRYR